MLSKDDFKEWGKNVTLFLHVTSRVKGDKHEDMLGKKGGSGFPHFAVLDSNGDLLAKVDGSRTIDGFTETIKKGKEKKKELADLKKKADGGDNDAAKKLFFEKIELIHYTPETGLEAMKALKLDDEEKKTAAGALVGLEVSEIMGGVSQDKATHIAAGKKFHAMHKDGKVPGDPASMNWMYFYYFMMIYAEDQNDPKLFEEALTIFKKEHAENQRYKRFIGTQEETLEKLKEGGEKKEDDKDK